ncbi:MAG TPA: AzlC family ABC transporter permease [Synergistaceae bacterium]|nr:AzlC family ABC transporter permease [Synergistaceae bacterium]HQF91109.1 AzlC family ABC transporter permease [Synergistaceae bacterium]HQH78879.1 AzlC family ABC transporter permease [Synergistaceae bacterium]HQK24952.1 AzlC family ABC transporter permease [Synergistaceae bacterium]
MAHGVKDFWRGFRCGIPIIVGYVPIALAFGVLAKTGGIPLWGAALFSGVVFAGASQFMALALWGGGAGMGEIILATFLVNFRHFLMSAALAARCPGLRGALRPLLAFGVTDEVFSLASLRETPPSSAEVLGLEAAAYGSWVGGTMLGFLLGEFLGETLRASLGIAIYAMFVGLLVPAVRRLPRRGAVALLAGGFHLALVHLPGVSSSTALVGGMVLGALVGSWGTPKEEGA